MFCLFQLMVIDEELSQEKRMKDLFLKRIQRIPWLNVTTLPIVVFILALALITITMLLNYVDLQARMLTIVFAIVMHMAILLKQQKRRILMYIAGLLIFVFINLRFPLEVGLVEETYFFLPIMLLCLTPGKLYANFVSILLVFVYYHSSRIYSVSEVIEDSMDVILVNLLLSISLMFYIKLTEKIDKFKQDSYTDYLTGCQNRKAFNDALDSMINHSKHSIGLMFFNLDNFKLINDTYGHSVGNQILIQLSEKMRRLENNNISFYRINGDEFSFIIEYKNEQELSSFIDLVLSILNSEMIYETYAIQITISAGISSYPKDSKSKSDLIQFCDLALSEAKANPHVNVKHYNQEMSVEVSRLYDIELGLKDAIKNNELSIVYQPQVDLVDNKIIGSEALLRWNKGGTGFVSPAEFIKIAEKGSVIIDIGKWVVEEVLNQMRTWQRLGLKKVISINVSGVQLMDGTFSTFLKKSLKAYDLQGHDIIVEITETALMKNKANIIQELNKIRDMGVSVALDDFGSEYSSFNYLSELPIDIIKIDQSFIRNCGQNKQQQMILNTIIQLGHNLKMKLIAEGVETIEQQAFLIEHKCDYMQGYLFSKPISVKDYNELIVHEE